MEIQDGAFIFSLSVVNMVKEVVSVFVAWCRVLDLPVQMFCFK